MDLVEDCISFVAYDTLELMRLLIKIKDKS